MLKRTPDSTGRRGAIINVASLVSFQGGLNVPAYAAAKGGIAQLTKSLSNRGFSHGALLRKMTVTNQLVIAEWAADGINVNAIAPGYIATDMNEALLADEKRAASILERIPTGRWGNPDDFVGSTVFLAGRGARYVSGEILTVDGGWMGR